MRTSSIFVCLIFVFMSSMVTAVPHSYQITADSIYKHISVLSSDSLEGREVGDPGEWKAAQYIQNIFKSAGLLPKGTNGEYLQPFDFIKKIKFGVNNRLVVNGKELLLNDGYAPLSWSANTTFDFKDIVSVDFGITTEDSSYNDYAGKSVEGKAVIIKRFTPPKDSASKIDFDKYSSFADKIATAINHNVAGIFFVTPSNQDDTVQTVGNVHVTAKNIPIIFLRRKGLEQLGINIDSPSIITAAGQTELVQVKDTGYNVIGYIRGKSDTTIILGAHYDHLGWGGSSSRYLEKEKKVHPGADDNGSGSSGLLELARYYSSRSDLLQHSILFTSFSGEEAGILGSSYFVNHWTIDSSKVMMMLNMDMIGRLKDQQNGLAVFGTGTAAEFKSYFDSVINDSLKITYREPGTGPSDHTAFYNNLIPVLHFFTGAHEDYHTPSDTPDKIDVIGIRRVVGLVADITNHFDSTHVPLTFQKTKDPDAGKRMGSYSVTLGIMPDFISQVKGLRVDGVSPDRPGEKAGIKKGDVIIQMGNIPIDDIYKYMSALGKFRKGDSTTVVIERGKDTINLPVVFK